MNKNLQPDQPVKLTSVNNEIEAGSLITALAADGILANATGGHTAGFRAEAPGRVDIWVRGEDLQAALAVMSQIPSTSAAIAWSTVDVGEPLDE